MRQSAGNAVSDIAICKNGFQGALEEATWKPQDGRGGRGLASQASRPCFQGEGRQPQLSRRLAIGGGAVSLTGATC